MNMNFYASIHPRNVYNLHNCLVNGYYEVVLKTILQKYLLSAQKVETSQSKCDAK